jgi:hypothetical protein
MNAPGFLAAVCWCLISPSVLASAFKQVEVEGYILSLPTRDTLIDHRLVEGPTGRYLKLLTRDTDDRVRSFVADLDEIAGESRLRGPLHHDTHQGVDLPMGLDIERTLIPIRALRSSCQGSPVYWAVVSVGLTQLGSLKSVLHIFRQTATETGLLLRYSENGALGSLERLVFRDLDGDCLPELIYVGRERGISMVQVFVVTAEDSVEYVQNLSAGKWEVMDLFSDHFYVTGGARVGVGEATGDIYWQSAGRYWWDPNKRRLVDEPRRWGD